MIETYKAICLKEPWLELILLLRKTLETRTRPMFKEPGDYVLASSKQYDEHAWDDPYVGGLLDSAAKERAMKGLGKLRGFARMSGFRPGVPGVDDRAACITIARPGGLVRNVSELTSVRRLIEVPTMRVQTRDGEDHMVFGASQGIFRVPVGQVQFA